MLLNRLTPAFVVVLSILVAGGKAAEQPAKPVVPVFKLKGALHETPSEAGFSLSMHEPLALKDLVARLQKARDDQSVKAVVITVDEASLAVPQIEELRQAMAQFRAGGKEIYAYADGLSMHSYALLAGATRISVVPTGDLWLTGMYGESPYLLGLFKKLGVAPDFLTCGKYKSAAEIFMREGPSPEAEAMQNWLMDGIFETQIKLIASGRGVDEKKVREWIDGGPYTAAKAKELGLIDAVEHRQDFEAAVRKPLGAEVKFNAKYGEKAQPKLDLSSPLAAINLWSEILGGPKKKVYKDSVAIVYVDGAIVLGDPEVSPLGMMEGGTAASTPVRKALDKAAADDTIKAVVLRVNSPGGSATASEIILDATRRVKAKKPLVVSMGDVAGSGGYYVSCGADTIFADEATITGSIGVVGGKLATGPAWQKLGIAWKGYQRGAHAAILSSAKPFSPEERDRMQAWMDEIYDVFKGHVMAIRGGRLTKPIDDLAGGRVYTGRQALELGLVDKLGTLDDAVKFAATAAKLEKYDLRVVPEPKNFLEKLIEQAAGDTDDGQSVSLAARPAGRASLVEAAMPYIEKLDPQRLSAVIVALKQLETLDREGVALMMPELLIRE
ncbi:MAG TPA: signal peptide peptidase SppA [Pirellulales bacterium]|nr:signal peptide peptidase SppA [Pirellulales bacterium]